MAGGGGLIRNATERKASSTKKERKENMGLETERDA